MKRTKTLTALLAASLILTACGKTAVNTPSDDTAAVTKDPTETGYYDAIPSDVRYDSYEFTILSYDTNDWNLYITGDETTGDVMDTAAYRRNTEVEDMLVSP